MFGKKCGSCHTLGEGDRTGPDLLGATKRRDRRWLTAFIRSPGALIDGGDAAANELLGKFKGVRMPDQSLTDDELAALLGYIDECSGRGGCKLSFGKVKAAREATAAEIAAGRALFEGEVALANGGAPCVSCHSVRGVGLVGGGTLAKDLTLAFARLGEQGTTAALASTPFPLMKNLYGEHPLRDAEAFKLKAFLYASSRSASQPPRDNNFFYLGALGAMASFGAIGVAWGGRLRGVRQSIVRRGHT
jgi:mono/diheme cytochrome c family protein